MDLKQLITRVVNDNQSLCLDSKDHREFLIGEMDLHIRHELEARAASIQQFASGETMLDTIQIRRLVKLGYSSPEIALKIGASKHHVLSFMRKTGLRSQTTSSIRHRLKNLENPNN